MTWAADAPDALLWGLLPRPVAVALAVTLAVSYVVGEITGRLNGPLGKLIARRAQKREQRQVGWRQRDEEVKTLRAALAAERVEKDDRIKELEQALSFVRERIASQDTELRILHRISDAQYKAIRAHISWDFTWVSKAREAGIDVPDPPSLYIDLQDVDPPGQG